jgi:YfiH family protein
MSELLRVDWPAPPNFHARVESKVSGSKELPLGLPIQQLEQVHGTRVLQLESVSSDSAVPQADAIYTRLENVVCSIRTADCLPVFFCSRDGLELAIAHAGWRGLAAGILENTLACFDSEPGNILVWLGPAIAACHFEVGEDVYRAFMQAAPAGQGAATAATFTVGTKVGKWQADLYQLAGLRLQAAGIPAANISGGGLCTYCDKEKFYSYRRDGEAAGRILSQIWRSKASL